MNHFLIILSYLFSIPFSSPCPFTPNPSTIKLKLCKDCVFFTKNLFTTNKFGKCALFPRKEYPNQNLDYFVDGTITKPDYYFCSTASHSDVMCGNEGKFYKEKGK